MSLKASHVNNLFPLKMQHEINTQDGTRFWSFYCMTFSQKCSQPLTNRTKLALLKPNEWLLEDIIK